MGTTGCLACLAAAPTPRPAAPLELAVRAGLAGLVVSDIGGWIATQYVRVHLMSSAAPAVVGLAASWAVSRAARRLRPPWAIWVVAASAALLGTALGFALTPGGQNPLRDWGMVGGPYLSALVGVAFGPIVFGTGRRRPASSSDQPVGEGAGDDVGTAT